MSRLVRTDADVSGRLSFTASPVTVINGTPGAPAAVPSVHGDQKTQVDNLSTRIVKYIPSEVIAFYLAADKLGSPVTPSGNDSAVARYLASLGSAYPWGAGLIVFLIALIATPFYYRFQADKGQPWGVNATVATVAFIVWAYASQGSVFEKAGIYFPNFASFAILIFTFISGLIVPGAKKVEPENGRS